MSQASRYSAFGTIVYGLFILVPLGILFLLLVKLTEILEKLAAPLGMESSLGVALALVIAVLAALAVVMLVSWVIGAIMQRLVSYDRFEALVLNEIPGYQIVANVARGFSEGETSYVPVLVELYGSGVTAMGFIMDEHADGRLTVYVPSAPVLTVGNILVVDPGKVTRLPAGAGEVADCISKWGSGSRKILSADLTGPAATG